MLRWLVMLIEKILINDKLCSIFKVFILIKNSKLTKSLLILLTIIFFLINPTFVNSAEILQINSSDTILIGDQNRNLIVKLFCVNVDESNTFKAKELLKKNFPRGTKVKIKPYGTDENSLLAKVYNLNKNIEMTDLLISENLTSYSCDY